MISHQHKLISKPSGFFILFFLLLKLQTKRFVSFWIYLRDCFLCKTNSVIMQGFNLNSNPTQTLTDHCGPFKFFLGLSVSAIICTTQRCRDCMIKYKKNCAGSDHKQRPIPVKTGEEFNNKTCKKKQLLGLPSEYLQNSSGQRQRMQLHTKICLVLIKSQSSLFQHHRLPSFQLHKYNHLWDCAVNYITDITKVKIILQETTASGREFQVRNREVQNIYLVWLQKSMPEIKFAWI